MAWAWGGETPWIFCGAKLSTEVVQLTWTTIAPSRASDAGMDIVKRWKKFWRPLHRILACRKVLDIGSDSAQMAGPPNYIYGSSAVTQRKRMQRSLPASRIQFGAFG